MTTNHTPHTAAVLLAQALGHLDRLQPASARGPVANMLTAGIEQCVGARSLVGKPLNFLLDLAQALVDQATDVTPV